MQRISRGLVSSSLLWKPLTTRSQCLPELSRWNTVREALPSAAIPMCCRTKVTKPTVSSENAVTATYSIFQPGTGKIYDKKPFKFTCIKGKSYLWCACGWSRTQPFCDSTHKNPHFRITMKPVRFIPKETKEYVFCNCKQTKNRPFCDGSHKREEIQAAVKS